MLRFIGVVRSEVRDRKQMPPAGAPAAVELYPEFAPALLHIEKHSHFWVLAWLVSRPERDTLQVIPRGADSLHGVFAVRSPARPNPIGLTAARLEMLKGLTLHFDQLDFLDGTGVIDIKPYFISRDLVHSARNAPIGRPKDREALRESLLFQVRRFCPEPHPDVELAIQIMEHFRIEVMEWREPEQWEITVPLSRPHLADALIGMTRVSLTRGLHLDGGENVVINGKRYAGRADLPVCP